MTISLRSINNAIRSFTKKRKELMQERFSGKVSSAQIKELNIKINSLFEKVQSLKLLQYDLLKDKCCREELRPPSPPSTKKA